MHAGVKAGMQAGLHAEMHGRVKEEMDGEIHDVCKDEPPKNLGSGGGRWGVQKNNPSLHHCAAGAEPRTALSATPAAPPPPTAQPPRRSAQQRPLQAAAGGCGTTAPRGQCGGRRQRACALRPPAPSLELRAASPGPSCRCSRAFPSTASRGGGNPPRCKLPCKVCNCTAPRCKESCCSESGKLQLHED